MEKNLNIEAMEVEAQVEEMVKSDNKIVKAIGIVGAAGAGLVLGYKFVLKPLKAKLESKKDKAEINEEVNLDVDEVSEEEAK